MTTTQQQCLHYTPACVRTLIHAIPCDTPPHTYLAHYFKQRHQAPLTQEHQTLTSSARLTACPVYLGPSQHNQAPIHIYEPTPLAQEHQTLTSSARLTACPVSLGPSQSPQRARGPGRPSVAPVPPQCPSRLSAAHQGGGWGTTHPISC